MRSRGHAAALLASPRPLPKFPRELDTCRAPLPKSLSHANLDRYVAIKVLHATFKEDPNFLARFQREAQIVAKLEHPSIVPIYDYNEHNGEPYLVMKFIEGETLKGHLARKPLTLDETIK